MPSWGSFIVAAVALLQYWIIAAWRRYFRPGTLDIHETGPIEIGYSRYGPTIGLYGTLRSVHRDIFVRDALLVVRRLRDQSQHRFDWAWARSGTATELPAGFLVPESQAQRYNLIFADVDTREDIGRTLAPVSEDWVQEIVANPPQDDAARYALYGGFSNTQVHVNAHAELTRLSYWDDGDYELLLEIHTTRPDKTFTKSWRFSLTQNDESLLRLNAIPVLRQTVGFDDVPLNFAFPLYQPPA
jgi:hypothetical protein